jgi:hypothetical protein
MKSAHLYHDALRRFDASPSRSLLLIPAEAADASWLQEKTFRDAYGVGAVVLSRETSAANELLAEFLKV